MKILVIIIALFIIQINEISGQNISGIVIDEKSNLPVAYVNIGVAKKNIGTVSDAIGRFHLQVDSLNEDDTVLFSCIGYLPVSIKKSDLKNTANKNFFMQKKYYELDEVAISPKLYKQKTLGVITRSRALEFIMCGNYDNKRKIYLNNCTLGREYGILMKIKKSAVIKSVNINIAKCTYDTIFYRLNIYQARGEMNFENILTAPIYINISKDQIKDKISIDLQAYNIVIDGDFLVTLEHVKDMGLGNLSFRAAFTNKTYYRNASQGQWMTYSVGGISISVLADVEK